MKKTNTEHTETAPITFEQRREEIRMSMLTADKRWHFGGLKEAVEKMENATPDYEQYGGWEEDYLITLKAREHFMGCREDIDNKPEIWSEQEIEEAGNLCNKSWTVGVQEETVRDKFGCGLVFGTMPLDFQDYIGKVKNVIEHFKMGFLTYSERDNKILGIILYYLGTHLKTGEDFVVNMWLQHLLKGREIVIK